jgi:hypothetical protein
LSHAPPHQPDYRDPSAFIVAGHRTEVTPNCFIVRDANGQALSYFYYENEPGRRSAAKLLSEDAARRIAANIAKLPALVRQALVNGHLTAAHDRGSKPRHPRRFPAA